LKTREGQYFGHHPLRTSRCHVGRATRSFCRATGTKPKTLAASQSIHLSCPLQNVDTIWAHASLLFEPWAKRRLCFGLVGPYTHYFSALLQLERLAGWHVSSARSMCTLNQSRPHKWRICELRTPPPLGRNHQIPVHAPRL
jgi:hypothetical protein